MSDASYSAVATSQITGADAVAPVLVVMAKVVGKPRAVTVVVAPFRTPVMGVGATKEVRFSFTVTATALEVTPPKVTVTEVVLKSMVAGLAL